MVTNCNTQLSPGPFNYPKDGKRRSWHLLLVKDGHNEVKDDKKRPKSNETHIGYNLRHVPRTHKLTLPTDVSAVIKQNFVYRILFRDIC